MGYGPEAELERRAVERELKIRDHELGGNNCEAYYFEAESFRAMAIEPSIEAERFRLYELVAHGIERVPHATRRLIGNTHPPGGFYFFAAAKVRDADPLAVRAVFEVLEELEPDWVGAVEDARRLADSPEVLAAWSEVPIEAVLAVLGNSWRTRL